MEDLRFNTGSNLAGAGTLVGGIGSAIGAVTNIATSIANAVNQQKQAEINQANYYRNEWREDTAVQRRVKDLQSAGLSPVLAAGSAASSTQAPVQTAPQIDPNLGRNISDMSQVVMQMIKMKQDIAQSNSQIQLNNSGILRNLADADQKTYNTDLYKGFGLPTNTGDWGHKAIVGIRYASATKDWIDKFLEAIKSGYFKNIGNPFASGLGSVGNSIKNTVTNPNNQEALKKGLKSGLQNLPFIGGFFKN